MNCFRLLNAVSVVSLKRASLVSSVQRVFRRYTSSMTDCHVRQTINDISKSAGDDRLYRALELNNGLRVLLVSDPSTDKSSAAMDVYIGHMKDPKDIPGLAHFCEHMLFLGTKKYPEENEYSKYLNQHGGFSNAFTSNEHTNFYFEVAPDYLEGALDRFAQFFLDPLFTASATEREINAVNSENDKNLQNDSWRFYQLDKSLACPDHDYNKFGTGNKFTLETRSKTLGYDVRNELLKFHSENYSSNLMGLTVLGKESLDELADLVVPLMSRVEDKKLSFAEWDTPPFGPEQSQTMCYITPVKDIRNLAIVWSIPDLHPYYKTNPGHYLGHLIGHEGKGSLLSELKSRGWVNTLSGGQQLGARGFMFCIVNVDLTEEGLEHVDDIITLTYQCITMLKKEGTKEWIFKECGDLSAMEFRFKDKERPSSYSSALASVLHDYPLREVLNAHYQQTEYKPELIDMVLEKLTPQNMRVSVVAKKFEGQTTSKEEWYGTEYKLEKIPEDKVKAWESCGLHESLSLPEKNEFIPTNFDLVAREPEQTPFPSIIKDTNMTRLWFRQDDKFLLPKSFAKFQITSPLVYIDPLHANLAVLFVSLFKDSLNEYAYAAEIAGLNYSLSSTAYGIDLSIKGYSDKVDVLLKKVIQKMVNYQIDAKRFEILKELYSRGLRNFRAEQPHQHAVYFTSVLMAELLWTQEELLNSLEEVTVEKLQAFLPQMFSKMYIEGLVYGNVTKQMGSDQMASYLLYDYDPHWWWRAGHRLPAVALAMTESIESILREQLSTKELLPSQRRHLREIQLPDGCYYVYHKTNNVHKSSSIEIYYQCGQQLTNTNMLLELFVQVISEPCFSILRTKEQLGYIVFSGVRRQSGVQGLRVIVQSDRTPEYLEERIEAFLHAMEDAIKDMSEEEFQKHVSALATKRLEKAKKMSAQASRYWGEIVSQQYNFDRDNIEVSFLKTTSKDDLYKFYKETIAHNAVKRHKVAVHVLSTVPPETDGEQAGEQIKCPIDLPQASVIQDVFEFKRDMALYPLARPFIDLQKAVSKL